MCTVCATLHARKLARALTLPSRVLISSAMPFPIRILSDRRRMSPECRAHEYSPSAVISYDKWVGNYAGISKFVAKDGTSKSYYHPDKEYSGTLAPCASLTPVARTYTFQTPS